MTLKVSDTYSFKINRNSATPVYRQIAEQLRRLQADGRAKSGDRLPPEEQLTTTLGVTRTTLRRALKELTQEGSVMQAAGRGTFFTGNGPLVQPLASSLISFSEALHGAGVPFTTELLSAVTRPRAQGVSTGLLSGRVHILKRIRRVDDQPVILLENHLSAEMFPGLFKRDLTRRELFAVLREDYATEPYEGTRTFEAAMAHREVAKPLGLLVGEPVMHVEQVIRRQDSEIIEISSLWLPARRFKLTAHIFRSDGRGL